MSTKAFLGLASIPVGLTAVFANVVSGASIGASIGIGLGTTILTPISTLIGAGLGGVLLMEEGKTAEDKQGGALTGSLLGGAAGFFGGLFLSYNAMFNMLVDDHTYEIPATEITQEADGNYASQIMASQDNQAHYSLPAIRTA